ncbi:MAG: prepilin-type N-terminal cleavage/methylation domain-containing protein [Puniceicoccaceae bacterium]|nr:MAG: prepilin-type N-terminal cleavage/methylation domain-containing protein [Puniceicoccaceae bacterium]
MHSSRSHRLGFTLIELLTVIAIIGILAAILIPVVGKVRESARWSQGSSNIRQVTMGMLLVAEDRNGRLIRWNEPPVAGGPNGFWADILTNFIENRDLGANVVQTAGILRDPIVRYTDTANPPGHHFAFVMALTFDPAVTDQGTFPPTLRPFSQISNHRLPSQQIYFADAAVNADGGGAHGDLHAIAGGMWAWANVWGSGAASEAEANRPIPPGNNEFGNIRWTDGRAKFGFMDGHVKTLSQDQVTYRMVNPLHQ